MIDRKKQHIAIKFVLWGAIILCSAVTLYLLLSAQYIRPLQDDFMYRSLQDAGEFGTLAGELYGWSGRLTSMTIFLIFGSLQMYALVPFIGFGLVIAGVFTLLFTIIMPKLALPRSLSRLLCIALALVVTVCLFMTMPSPYSTLFWLSAAPIHLWSYGLIMLLAAGYVGVYRRNKTSGKEAVILLASSLLIGMMGEIAACILVLLFAGGLALSLLKKRKWLSSAAGLIGSLMALAVLFLSPGAASRRRAEETEFTSDLVGRFPYVVYDNFSELVRNVLNNRLLIVVLFVVGLLGGLLIKKGLNLKRAILWWLGIGVGLMAIMALNYIAVYSSVQFAIVWSRTQALSTLIVLGMVLYSGFIAAYAANTLLKKLPVTGVIIASSVVVVLTVGVVDGRQYVSYVHDFKQSVQTRAMNYDERQKVLDEMRRTGVCGRVNTTTIDRTQEGFDVVEGEPYIINLQFSRYHNLPCVVEGDLTLKEAAEVTHTVRTK